MVLLYHMDVLPDGVLNLDYAITKQLFSRKYVQFSIPCTIVHIYPNKEYATSQTLPAYDLIRRILHIKNMFMKHYSRYTGHDLYLH